MICPQCGETLPTDETVCAHCGQTLSAAMATAERCSVCGAHLTSDTSSCPQCGTSRASQDTSARAPYVAPSEDEQQGPPTIPYARSRLTRPPKSPAPRDSLPPFGETEGTPADEPTMIPVLSALPTPVAAEAAAGSTDPSQPTTPASASDDDALAAYETPDKERPAIHAPRPPLPDYETPDDERPAVRLPGPPLPDYETPDEERPAIHPVPMSRPAGSSGPPRTATGAAQVPDTTQTYHPNEYTSPHAAPTMRTPLPTSSRATAASNAVLNGIFGEQPPASARTANTLIQRLWLRYLPSEWAAMPWISIPVAALVALTLGLIVTAIGLLFWSHAIGYLLNASSVANVDQAIVRAILSPNVLQLFLLEHGVPVALALGSPGATGSFSALESPPLTGLSLIPAWTLVLAGYVAAASDFSHRLRYSVVRGALVGPVYALLLLLVALFGSSTVRLPVTTIIQLHPSLGYAFLSGLLWGTLLGALGGLLAIRGYRLFTTNRQPDFLAGGIWGAFIALGSGVLLAFVALVTGIVAQVVGTMPSAAAGNPSGQPGGAMNSILTAIALLIVIAPVATLWLYALGTGATIDHWLTASGASVHPENATFGLLVAQHHPTSIAWWLLLLIPLASYIIGGRAAARIARAQSLRDGAIAGGLMAVALSLLILVLALLSRVLISSNATLFEQPVTTNLGIALSAGAVFLLVLIIGGLVGAAGGASTIVAPRPGPLLISLAAPLLLRLDPALALAQRPWDIFDAARGKRSPRTALAALLYAALLSAILLVALFLVVVLIGWIASRFAPVAAIRGFDGFFAGLAVGIPLLLLASAAILVVTRTALPLLTAHPAKNTPILPRYP